MGLVSSSIGRFLIHILGSAVQIGTQIASVLVILIVNQAHYILASYTSKCER